MTNHAAEEMKDQAAEADGPFQAAGRVAGWLGLTPFIVLSLWLYGIAPDHPWRSGTILLLLVYSAVVLSFLGGVRWGAGLTAEGADKRPGELWLALPPAFIGWIAVVVPVPLSFAILAVAFAALGAWDALATHRNKLPEWYGRLRIILTVGAVAMLLLAFASTS
ncbi:DUF3429 domain-containing protein [Mesorhizobium sp. IMUNJ 23232]|uniref:DUF3429 domain-containing protein n=1 Tax=Mesorhizobium sp. IMUNJ 23232 TaxID=3376064 RepID=UPI0037AD4637